MTTQAVSGAREAVRKLFLGNITQAIRRGEHIADDAYLLPEEWGALGYTGVAQIMNVGSGAIRHYWQADLRRGFSQSLPAPDVLIERVMVRKDGTEAVELLPGWYERTILDWLPFRVGPGNHTTNESPGGRRGNTDGRTGWRKDARTGPDAEVLAPS